MEPTVLVRAAIGRLRHMSFAPRTVIAGVVFAFVALCFMGREAATKNVHKDFVRFTQYIAPDTKYYATVNEMTSIVRERIKPGQILVVVGGNSVLYGVGQPRDKIWTKALQAELGDAYLVVNFAFRGSLPTDGAAVAAEALRNEFPRQIYIANAAPGQDPNPEGSLVYRFMFWDAWAKGYLDKHDANRNAKIALSHANPALQLRNGFVELRIRNWLDRWLYFQDFWNDVTVARFNTVWGVYMPWLTRFLQPRNNYADPEPDFINDIPLKNRFLAENMEIEMANVRGTSQYAFYPDKTPEGKWKVYEPLWTQFSEGVRSSFPEALKKRTLILMSNNSPYYINRLLPDEIERNGLSYALAVRKWEEAGYASIEYGKDFHPTQDFGDRTHLTWKGGEKLAKVTADKVRAMSVQLGYLPTK